MLKFTQYLYRWYEPIQEFKFSSLQLLSFSFRAQNMKDKFAFLRRKSPDPSSQSKHLPADPPPRDVIENWKNGFSILLNDKCKFRVVNSKLVPLIFFLWKKLAFMQRRMR